MKLTEGDDSVLKSGCGWIFSEINNGEESDRARELYYNYDFKQILENQEKAEKWDRHEERENFIMEQLKKRCLEVENLEKENKQLKEEKDKLLKAFHERSMIAQRLKEHIDELPKQLRWSEKHRDYRIWLQLKEILGEKK